MAGIAEFLQGMFRPPQAQQTMNADPMQGMGGFQRLQYMQQNNPEALMGLASGLMQGNMGAGFAAAGQAMGDHRREYAQQAEKTRTNDLTRKWLLGRGLNEDETEAALANPVVMQELMKGGDPAKANIINAGAGNLYNADTGEWLSAPGGGAEGIAGLSPVWGRDANGNWTIGQLTKDGKVLQSELPQGFTPAGPYEKAFQTGAGGEAGKVAGGAQTALPGARQVASRVNEQVQSLKSDPYLPRMLGPIDSRLPSFTADAARVQSKIDQLNSGAFLEARQALKGGGAITDFESQKAEAALARLSTAQSEKDFKEALDEFNSYIQQGLQKLEAQAGMTGNPNAPAAPAQGGGMDDPLGIRN